MVLTIRHICIHRYSTCERTSSTIVDCKQVLWPHLPISPIKAKPVWLIGVMVCCDKKACVSSVSKQHKQLPKLGIYARTSANGIPGIPLFAAPAATSNDVLPREVSSIAHGYFSIPSPNSVVPFMQRVSAPCQLHTAYCCTVGAAGHRSRQGSSLSVVVMLIATTE